MYIYNLLELSTSFDLISIILFYYHPVHVLLIRTTLSRVGMDRNPTHGEDRA